MDNDYISHYGVKRRSGRYPWGSGERPYQNDPAKARLYRKAEKVESNTWKRAGKMASYKHTQGSIDDYIWGRNNKLDDINRKLIRLETRSIAESVGIADKKIQNSMADYEWAKQTAAQYMSEGRSESKIDQRRLERDVYLWGPILTLARSKSYTLKGADYYEKISKKSEEILNQKLPDYAKMLHKKG